MYNTLSSLLCFVLSVFFSSVAMAQVETSFFGGGGVRIGWSSSCGTSHAGALRYNSAGSIEFCNGTVWASVGGSGGSFAINDLGDAVTNYTNSNVFLGEFAGTQTTTGAQNTAFGYYAANSYITGDGLTAFGNESARYMRRAGNTENTAFGARSLRGSTTPASNILNIATAIGFDALFNATDGDRHTAFGAEALRASILGQDSTVFGYRALFSETIPYYTTAFGSESGANKQSTGDVLFGYRAAYNTAGYSGGSDNVAIGYQALLAINTGARNVAVGYQALSQASGNNNTAVGYQAGDNLTTGSNNIIIGHDIDFNSATGSDQLNIAGIIFGNLSNGRLGINKAVPDVAVDVVGDIQYTGTLTDVSDRRLKNNIQSFESARNIIMSVPVYSLKINPVCWNTA